MIRVGFDVGPLHGPMTGIGRAVDGIFRGLAEPNNDVDLVPFVLSFRASLQPGTIRLPYPAALALRAWSRFDRPRPDRHLTNVDLIHGTNYVVPPSRRPRLVSVYDCWALDNDMAVHPDVRSMMKVLRRAVNTGAHIHASSQATADALRRHFPDASVSVVHLGAPDIVEPSDGPIAGVPDGSRFVLTLGTIERRKNIPFLVDCMNTVMRQLTDVRLVVAGGASDDSENLQRAIDRTPVDVRSRVHVLGRVDDDVANKLLHRATAFAYPSLDEGFGFPLLEAMGARTPIVASSVGSIPEVAGDAAHLCAPNDHESWVSALTDVLQNDDKRNRMIIAGAKQRDRFDWSATSRNLANLYSSLLERA
jgi:glycosyltransferase involved in cell wall biosynthesis